MRVLVLLLCACAARAALPAERSYHRAGAGARAAAGAGAGARSDVIGTIDDDERTPAFWEREFREGIEQWEARKDKFEDNRVAKHLVMFLGDGMSVPTLAAARTLMGQRQNRTGEESHLSFDDLPTTGLSKTYCVDQQIPDSACTATAYLCGVKNNYGTIGVTARVKRHDCKESMDETNHLTSIASWALDAGMDVGIVTTTRITHASPAGTYAKVANRDWESDADVWEEGYDPADCPDIAHQLVHGDPASRFKVILGAGLREFIPRENLSVFNEFGRRLDGRDLIQEWEQKHKEENHKWAWAWDRQSLQEALEEEPDYLFGLFRDTHMQYHELAPETQPTLPELTEAAIRLLSRNPKGFFLFVEGGRIDHAHHDNYPVLALTETIELSKSVDVAKSLLNEDDSLIVVTSDHSHVMAYNGYAARGSNILGPSDKVDLNGVPYMTISYANGPGFRPHVDGKRPDVTLENDFGAATWESHVDVPLEDETHGGEDVGVFAWGAQHGSFAGVYEQSRLPRLMARAGCVGPPPHAPACSANFS